MREGIPPGSMFNQTGDTYQLILPPANEFCDRLADEPANRCPGLVIINGTDDVEYEIDGKEFHYKSCCTCIMLNTIKHLKRDTLEAIKGCP